MIQNKVGRPRGFDKQEALQSAINVFWEKGYEGASMRDLTQAMGINSPSLYSVFGDKHKLYLEAIESYANSDACAPLVAFETEENIELAVAAFLKAAISYATDHSSGVMGCFLSTCVSASAGSVDGTKDMLFEAVTSTDEKLASRFDLEKKRGTLAKDFPSLQRARFMFDLRQGFVLRARAGVSAASMLEDIDYRVSTVLS